MSNKMKVFDMKDIHSGYVVKFRNGKFALCMRVGRNFTKIFACVDSESQKIGAIEENTFVYASNYRECNCYFSWNRVSNRPFHKTDFDIVAVYGLIEGTRNYLFIIDANTVGSLSNRPLLWEEEVKEMTLEEIEAKLGHRVKVVTNTKAHPIKREGCKKCKYGIPQNSHCPTGDCNGCRMSGGRFCLCTTISPNDPCPYFEEAADNE